MGQVGAVAGLWLGCGCVVAALWLRCGCAVAALWLRVIARGCLHVGYGDIEVLGEVCVPDEPHVGNEEGAEVALVRRQVPYARYLHHAPLGEAT